MATFCLRAVWRHADYENRIQWRIQGGSRRGSQSTESVLVLVRFKSDPLAAFLLFFWLAQRGSDRNLPLGVRVRWVWHKNVSHPNHSSSATTLATCYASTESLGLSELNDTNIISFGVPERTFRELEFTNFATIIFTLPHNIAPKFVNQLPLRNVGRTCNGSGNVWNWESRSRCTGTLENAAPHKIRCGIFFFILHRGDVIHAICVEATKRNADELWKPTHQSFWFADLRIRVSTLRNCYANAADHVTKSDLKVNPK